MASDALCFSGLWNSKYDPQAVLEDLKAGVQRAEEQRAASGSHRYGGEGSSMLDALQQKGNGRQVRHCLLRGAVTPLGHVALGAQQLCAVG